MTFNPIVVSGPAEQPGTDLLTGTSEGPFIDTGVYTVDPMTGRLGNRIYLARSTVEYLASLFDEKQATPSQLQTEYARGVLDGQKEVFGGDLVSAGRDIRRFLDMLDAGNPHA